LKIFKELKTKTQVMTQELSQQYQKKTDKEHILDNADTYIGSIEAADYDTYVYNPTPTEDSFAIIPKNICIIPGLYNLFNEGIVNCRDHYVRMAQAIAAGKPKCIPVTEINITIADDGVITMYNNGNGIDVAKHPVHDHWIPEMIFAHLRTSTNYDKKTIKIVGGKNGFGVKLVLIWSTWGEIETVDHVRGLKYKQAFRNNLDVIESPTITKCKAKPYTKISFKPDIARLGIEGYSDDLISLFKRRVVDITALTGKNVAVKFNGNKIPVKSFQSYIDQYIGTKGVTKRIYEEGNERWEYAVCLAPAGEFTQISFVNGLLTGKGGKHVEYIVNQITKKMITYIKAKKKVVVKPSTIKEQIMVFLRCDIENPTFDSQTKDFMSTPVNKFGSTCIVSNGFVDKLAKLGVMNASCALTEVKDTNKAKKTDGSQTKNIRGIPKLVDANWAGTARSQECTIILCEGDSAKAGIISGLSKTDRDAIGVYPMKGKLFNTRGETAARIGGNKEISEIKQVLGLAVGREYTAESVKAKLRYGRVLFMTDQDLDGSHIKGLGLNLFDSEWSSLLDIPNFIGFMNTPIIKAKKGKKTIVFYNEGEYEQWKETIDSKSWTIKYFKGLGTSTSKEFKEYFADQKVVMFSHEAEEENITTLDMVFNKKRSADRKVWLGTYDRASYLDTNKTSINVSEFIDRELKHFSKYDNDRSIANGIDGLKVSLRKILFSGIKKRLTKEIKVAQFSGYVSEHSGYHHGEASLNGAIIGMAQKFVGSNNINLFEPNGQFGSRLQGGKDSASERYIFTNLSKLTRMIYPEADDAVLQYLDDDGDEVEPIYYVPILPMILVNGCKGIGTGFSTDILSYNPLEITGHLKKKLGGYMGEAVLNPYYEGFKGVIESVAPHKYLVRGCCEIISDKLVRVTELPVGTWTEDYKVFLEAQIDNGKKTKGKAVIKDYIDSSTEASVDFTVTFYPDMIHKLVNRGTEYGCNGLEKALKLYTTMSTSNMHLFTKDESLKKYTNVDEIINDHYVIRFQYYEKRKAALLQKLAKEKLISANKARFITEILNEQIDLRNKKMEEVVTLLETREYDQLDTDATPYKYLISMPMSSLTSENIEHMIHNLEKIISELEMLTGTTVETMWLGELRDFEKAYKVYFNCPKKAKQVKKLSVKF